MEGKTCSGGRVDLRPHAQVNGVRCALFTYLFRSFLYMGRLVSSSFGLTSKLLFKERLSRLGSSFSRKVIQQPAAGRQAKLGSILKVKSRLDHCHRSSRSGRVRFHVFTFFAALGREEEKYRAINSVFPSSLILSWLRAAVPTACVIIITLPVLFSLFF